MAVHGVSIQNLAVAESSFRAATPPTAASAVPLEELMLKPNREFVDIKEMRRIADKLGWIPGKISGEWSAKSQWRLPSALGAVPELDVILANAFGTAATVVPSTSVTYNQSTFEQAANTFTLIQQGGGIVESGRNEFFLHQAKGCVAKKLTFNIEGGQPTTIEMEGEFSDYGYLFGAPTVSGTVALAATAIPLTTNNGRFFRGGTNGIYVQFGTNDNSGAGYQLTNGASADAAVAAPGIADTALADGDLIRPFFPAATYAGDHLDGVTNELILNDGAVAANVGFIKAQLEFNTGLFLLNKEATSALAHRVGRTQRSWTGQLSFYLENENAFVQVGGFEGTEYATTLRFGGSTAGSRYTMTMPAVRLDVVSEIPFTGEEDEGTEYTVNLSARQTSGENAATLSAD